jgi:hypothetical protein
LGAPPEDDPGTPGDGAPQTAISPQLSERARSLAARVDAMLADDDDEPSPGRATNGPAADAAHAARDATDDIDEIEGEIDGEIEGDIEEVEDTPPPRAPMAFRAPAPTPPPLPTRPPVVMVPPPRPTSTRTPPVGTPRPPLVPRASTPTGVPTVSAPAVAIPPRDSEARADARDGRIDARPEVRLARPEVRFERPEGRPEPSAPGAEATVEPGPSADVAPGPVAAEQANGANGAPLGHELPSQSSPTSLTDTLGSPTSPGLPAVERRRSGNTLIPPLGDTIEGMMGPGSDTATLSAGGVEVSTEVANIVVDKPLEAHLESPTVLDRALDELGDAGGERRAETMARDLEATADPAVGAMLAYELGELYERRLADEARAVKAYGRALTLDPALRANLWAIRRVFYRRQLWPNLVKLIAAEVAYARDDYERADLLLEKARIAGEHMNDAAEAKTALDEAIRIAPQHQAALLEL